MIRVTQIRSSIGTTQAHRGTLRALGLRKIGQSAVHRDTPALRGRLRRVAWLVRAEEIDGE